MTSHNEPLLINISNRLYRTIFAVCVLLGCAMLVIGTMQVFWRYVLQHSLSWSEEVLRYLNIWTIFLGISIAIPQKMHVAVDAVYNHLKEAPRRILYFVIQAVNLVFYGLMLVLGLQFTLMNISQLAPSIRISLSWIYISIPIGALLAIGFTVVEIVKYAGRKGESQ